MKISIAIKAYFYSLPKSTPFLFFRGVYLKSISDFHLDKRTQQNRQVLVLFYLTLCKLQYCSSYEDAENFLENITIKYVA
jgi:hypothetical protein